MIAYRWTKGNETHQSTEKPIDVIDFVIVELFEKTKQQEEIEQKEFELKQKKELQYNELLKTDWYFTRFIEKGIAVPKEIIEQRELIRNK